MNTKLLVGSLIVPAFSLIACSSGMKVDVKLFNSEDLACLPPELELHDKLEQVAGDTIAQEAEIAEIREGFLEEVDRLLADPEEKVGAPKRIRRQIASTIDSLLKGVVQPRRAGVDRFYAAEAAADPIVTRKLLWEARKYFLDGDRSARDLIFQVESELGRNFSPGADRKLSERLDRLELRIAANLITQPQLLEDPLAPIITDDSKYLTCWRSTFNTAKAETSIGNSDIAIVMTGLGDFSIKGLRLDAAAVTAAAFDGIRSGLSIIAQSTGLAGKLGGSSKGQNPAALTFDNSSDLAVRRGPLDLAVRDFLETLLVHRERLADANARKDVIVQVKKNYEALRFELNPAASATPVVISTLPPSTTGSSPQTQPATPAVPGASGSTSSPPSQPATPTPGGTSPSEGGTIHGTLTPIPSEGSDPSSPQPQPLAVGGQGDERWRFR